MDAAVVETIGPVSHLAPAGGWNRTWPRGIGRRCSPRFDDDQPSFVGHRHSADFWFGKRWGNDGNHGSHSAPFCILATALRPVESQSRGGFRICERRVWIISLLPDWFRQRIVYRPSELDSEVGQASVCRD